MSIDPLRNGKDPLRKSGPDQSLELFRNLSQLCSGFSGDDVISASFNLMINAIRQSYLSRREAEARYDDLLGRNKSLLLNHYDSVTGRRRNIFPFTQVISPPHFVDPDTFKP